MRLIRWLSARAARFSAWRLGGSRSGSLAGLTTRPWLEVLEERRLPSTFTVTDTSDDPNDVHSLGHALANLSPGGNTINFAIGAPGSVQAINVGSVTGTPLPAITQPVDILGVTQGGTGYKGPPLIVLNGSQAGSSANGLDFEAGSSGSEVQGLVIQQFSSNGILVNGTSGNLIAGNYIGTDVQGIAARGNGACGVVLQKGATANTVGGTASGTANVISGNGTCGVVLTDPGTSGNLVQGNLIGTDITGTAGLGNNASGLVIGSAATANTVGGTASGAANVISGNGTGGVVLAGTGTSGNLVQGNLIGTDITGTANLGNNGWGLVIAVGATANTVGGSASGAANVISGNGTGGVVLTDPGTSGNVVQGNLIGTDITGTANLGNRGVGLSIGSAATANTVGGSASGTGNVISGNGTDGVVLVGTGTSGNVVLGNLIGTDITGTAKLVNGADGVVITSGATANTIGGTGSPSANRIAFNAEGIVLSGSSTVQDSILSNSIFSNNGLGIDLGSPPANHGQPAPQLTSLSSTPVGTAVQGTLTATPGTYLLQFFASPSSGPSFQGQTLLGSVNVTVPGTGTTSFTATGLLALPAGSVATATATNTTPGPRFGDTSQFNQGLTLTPTVTVTFQPTTVRFSSSPQLILLIALVQNGLTRLLNGQVTFAIEPAGGGKPVGSVMAQVINGVAKTTFKLPAALPPGSYKIVATYHDPLGVFPDVIAQSPVPLTVLFFGFFRV